MISRSMPGVAPKEQTQAPSREWPFVVSVIVIILVLTSLPYIYGARSAPPEKAFMGMMLDVPDHLQYFSWMRELTASHLSANKLTPEPNAPVFFNLLWWMMGRFGDLVGLGYAGMFQVLRVVSGILFFLMIYRLFSWLFKDRLMRQTAFLITAFTSGFGWVLVFMKYTVTQGELLNPLDVYVAEGNTFISLLGYPHFVAAMLYIFVFDLVLRGEAKGKYRYAVWAGLVALFLGWQHAYDLLIVYAVLGAYGLLRLLRDRAIPRYLLFSSIIIAVISWWPALYSVLLTSLDPLWKEVLAQFSNAGVFTPPLYRLPVLMGFAFLFAIYTLIRNNPLRLSKYDNNDLFVMGWFLITFVLIYIPADFQIHMLNGWQVPIAILATQGLFRYVIPAVKRLVEKKNWQVTELTVQKGVIAAFLLIIIPTNAYLFFWRFYDLSRSDYPFYLYHEELGGMAWLEQNAQPDDVVLSSEMIGQYIPAYTGTYAFLAHWAQTVDYYTKVDMVNEFYSAEATDMRRMEILSAYSVDYVFYGPYERRIGSYGIESAAFLEQVYATPLVEIYQVKE
jgi:hypothetical protein